MSTVRLARLFEYSDVMAIRRTCHPGWPEKPTAWYVTHPTLVLLEGQDILGFTAVSVGFPLDRSVDGEVMYGHDLCVRPDARGRGYGRALADERLALGRRAGIARFLGMTAPDNHPMLRIFAAQGLKQCGRLADAYPDGSEALIYVGDL